MKRSWIGFILLLVLLAGGIAATWGMAKCHEPIARDLENAAKTALQGDMAQGEVLMLQAREAWGRSRHLGACFADHTPMEEIDALFAEVEVYAAAREENGLCCQVRRPFQKGGGHGAGSRGVMVESVFKKAAPSCLSLWERWPSAARTERVYKAAIPSHTIS